ncbi:MAG: glutaredoxin family protein [Candidatus Planktophila sp.]|jgi:glutaredoxin|tara:strand:+ start:14036 stop:14290 length:255 start_codon:yes stop_codon:yes gene_type:complete
MRTVVTVYSRTGCHLCESAEATLINLSQQFDFDLKVKLIDEDIELEKLYGNQVPVIQINGEHHDFYKVDPERFKSSLEKHRLHQ